MPGPTNEPTTEPTTEPPTEPPTEPTTEPTTEPAGTHDRWRAVARVGDVRRGDVIAVNLDGLELVLGLDGERYFATQRRCVHRGGDLADGIVSRGHVICPQHGWRFSTETGRAPESAEFCLVTYPVRVSGDQVEVDPSPQKPPATLPEKAMTP